METTFFFLVKQIPNKAIGIKSFISQLLKLWVDIDVGLCDWMSVIKTFATVKTFWVYNNEKWNR